MRRVRRSVSGARLAAFPACSPPRARPAAWSRGRNGSGAGRRHAAGSGSSPEHRAGSRTAPHRGMHRASGRRSAEAVLHRHASRDGVAVDAGPLARGQDRHRGQRCPVVRNDRPGPAAKGDRRAEPAGDARAERRGAGDEGQARPIEVVDDGEGAEPPVSESANHGIEAATPARRLRHTHRPLVPSARLRPPRRRTWGRSSRPSRPLLPEGRHDPLRPRDDMQAPPVGICRQRPAGHRIANRRRSAAIDIIAARASASSGRSLRQRTRDRSTSRARHGRRRLTLARCRNVSQCFPPGAGHNLILP